MGKTGAINIRGISKDLIRELKVEAAKRGLTLRDYIIQMLDAAVSQSIAKGRELGAKN
jgi:predicted DNA binding CopG/RHH family protein